MYTRNLTFNLVWDRPHTVTTLTFVHYDLQLKSRSSYSSKVLLKMFCVFVFVLAFAASSQTANIAANSEGNLVASVESERQCRILKLHSSTKCAKYVLRHALSTAVLQGGG